MVAEAKAWGQPEAQWAKAQPDNSWKGVNSPQEHDVGECKSIVETLLSHAGLPKLPSGSDAGDGSDEIAFNLDLSSEKHSLITWEEFRIMFSKYWISRKFFRTCPTSDHDSPAVPQLRTELAHLKTSQLRKRALKAGVDEARIDNAEDADHSRETLNEELINLIVQHEIPAANLLKRFDSEGQVEHEQVDKLHEGTPTHMRPRKFFLQVLPNSLVDNPPPGGCDSRLRHSRSSNSSCSRRRKWP